MVSLIFKATFSYNHGYPVGERVFIFSQMDYTTEKRITNYIEF